MKTLIFAAVIGLLLLTGFSAWAEDGYFVIGVPQNPPYSYTDESGTIKGLGVDLLKAVGETEGWELIFVEDSMQGCIKGLESGEYDAIPGLARTYYREQTLDFTSVPISLNWAVVYAPPRKNIVSILQLRGCNIGVTASSDFIKALSDELQSYQIPFLISHVTNNIEANTPNRIHDAVILNRNAAPFLPRDFSFEETPVIFYPHFLYIAVPKGRNTGFIYSLDTYLLSWKEQEDSIFHVISGQYLDNGTNYRKPLTFFQLMSYIILSLLLPLLTAIIASLQKRFRKITAELKNSKMQAEASDRLKTTFLANMSHEIRSPLNALVGFSKLLADGNLDPGKREKYISIVNDNSRQLLSIISDILDVSRIDSGNLELHYSSFSLNHELDTLKESILNQNDSLKSSQTEILIEKALQNGEDTIYSDQVRLRQVLTNLLNNALKYTEKGSVTIGYDPPRSGSDNRRFIQLFVSDTGIGIPQNRLGLIFDRFRQVDEGFDRKFGGSGLGLSISKILVEMLDGVIQVKSELGVGTTFHISIPIDPKESGHDGR